MNVSESGASATSEGRQSAPTMKPDTRHWQVVGRGQLTRQMEKAYNCRRQLLERLQGPAAPER